MTKPMHNLLIPTSIIIALLVIGGAIYAATDGSQSAPRRPAAADKLRVAELSVPGMYCAGCTASVESYLSSIAGVVEVAARLKPEKSATVVYHPGQVSLEKITANPVFDVYGSVKVTADKPYRPSDAG